MNTHLKINPTFIQPAPKCLASGWRSQFARPSGRLGSLAGRLMALKNAGMNRFAVGVLDLQLQDQVLEVGFGPGRTIEMIAERVLQGHVAGIDLSEVMVRQAARRNLDRMLAGRVELIHGSVANLPYEFGRFNKVLAVNNYHLWPNQELNLIEIRRVMCEGGLLVLCLRMNTPKGRLQLAPGFSDDEIEETVGLVRWVGFRNVHLQEPKAKRNAACVLATR